MRAALILVVAASAARANSVTEEVLVNSTQASETNPHSRIVTSALNGNFELNEDLALLLGANVTFQSPTSASGFRGSGSVATLFTTGFDWFATQNLTLGVIGNLQPSNTQDVATSLTLPTGALAAAQLRSTSSELGAGFDASWDTLGKSDLEWSFDASFDFSHYDVTQTVTGTSANFTEFCATFPRRPVCTRTPQDSKLDFERLSGTALATLFTDTDVAISADYYVYNQDPTQFGFFRLVSPSLPIAPLRYLIHPEVVHRFGDFSAKLWLQAGEYVAQTGSTTAALGTRLQYRFNKTFRLWLTASGQRDVDASDRVLVSGTFSIGAGYRW